jgi:CubicO group peptidase (beta-lactamase class C family)
LKSTALLILLILARSVVAADASPVPRFTDPARRSKLEAAFPEIDAIFERFWRDSGVPGLVYGIVIDGDLAHVKSFGVRDRRSNEPVAPDTVFRIASMTKSFTALAILKLRDEGKLSLDDPAEKWIPEIQKLRYPTRDSALITIRHLLTHGAGFPEDNPWGDRQLGRSAEELTRWLRAGIPFSTAPGSAYEYSNYGFALLGRIVEKASGTSYRSYLEHQILAPIGMKSSTLEPAAVPANLRAQGYRRSTEGYTDEPSLPHGAFGSMGGLLTSAQDLGRYVAWQLSAFPPRDEDEVGPLRRSSAREMQQEWRPYAFSADRQNGQTRATSGGYGYGLRVSRDCRFERIVGHGGGLPGFGSYMSWLPEYGVGLFAMANLTYAAPTRPIDEALDALLRTGALRPRELPPSAALLSARAALVRLFEGWDDTTATKMAAENLFLDYPAQSIQRDMERARASVGNCRSEGDLEPENLLRASFRINCDRGFVGFHFTLAPTTPPMVQYLRVTPAVAPDDGVRRIVDEVATLVGSFSQDAFKVIAAPTLNLETYRRLFESIQASYGPCRAGTLLGGDGRSSTQFRFECRRGPVNVRISLTAEGKVREVTFARPSETPCVP